MRCGRCGSMLDDDAVFCYKCGDFVMREEETEPLSSERTGKRRRGSAGHRRLIIRIVLWAAIAAAGITAAVFGYSWIAGQWTQVTISP